MSMSGREIEALCLRAWKARAKGRPMRWRILEELESERSVVQEKDDKSQVFKWGATAEGVAFWIGKRENIPVSIVQVAVASGSVLE